MDTDLKKKKEYLEKLGYTKKESNKILKSNNPKEIVETMKVWERDKKRGA